ncbi:MAG: TetR/AcrR family transcriptional regulator [Verrucomicrobiota bacterium]
MRSKKQRTRLRILQAAAGLFRQRGYNNTSVDDVMAKAGLTVGGFYAHFKSKQDLFAHALEHAAREGRSALEEGTEGLHAADRLKAYVARYLSREHLAAVDRGCLLPPLLGDASRASNDARDSLEKAARRRFRNLIPLLGTVAPAKEREKLGIALAGLCVGGLSLARGMQTPDLQDEILSSCRETGFGLIDRAERAHATANQGACS